MKAFTAVTPATYTLPPDLALLLSPVRASEPSAPDEYVGRAEGVVLDDEGRVQAFIVRISSRLAAENPRTLVSAGCMSVTGGSTLHLSWTEDQLLAQPRLDANLQPHNRVDGGAPVESQWMPARPNVVPPSDDTNATEAVKEGLQGGVAGAVIGAIAGMAIGGPIGAVALAGFFAAGGGLAGVISGATQETAVEAGEMKFDNVPAEQDDLSAAALRVLEERLRDPSVSASGLVHATRFVPMTSTETKSGSPQSERTRSATRSAA